MSKKLADYKGKSPEDIQALLDGFKKYSGGHLCCLFYSKSQPYMVKLSREPEAAAAFVKACRGAEPNKHLPKIFVAGKIGDDLHVTVMESLKPVMAFKNTKKKTMGGIAYAISSFAEGTDETHDVVYSGLEHEADLVAAVEILAEGLEKSRASLSYQSGSQTMAYRRDKDAVKADAVFVNPYHSTDKNAEAATKISQIKTRLNEIKARL